MELNLPLSLHPEHRLVEDIPVPTPQFKEVGIVSKMPGTGFTCCVFNGTDIPVDTKLYVMV